MPKTLLAVDDSATMRKVLEITFSGEDFKVVTADGPAAARSSMSEQPSVVVLDTSLDGDAYALAKELRAKDAKLTIILLSSRYNAYDANKGRDSGADDYMDKPFDTQQLIDKVRKAMLARESGAPASAAAAKPAAAAASGPTQTTPSMQSPFANKPAPAPLAAAAAAPPPVVVAKPASQQRTHTLSFENTPAPAAVAAKGAPPAAAATAKAAPAAAAAPAARGAAADVSGSVNGQLAGKLSELGLTPAQADAVLALSREVVERVVWEVVPQLAETIIKEEIARLTKEG